MSSAALRASRIVLNRMPVDIASSNDTAALYKVSRDFRSDTFTCPTSQMFAHMIDSSRGDDVYGEDQSTNALQDRVAKMTGKEAGLFCVSGTMTNQVAIRTHLQQPPYSVIVDHRAHVHRYEAGGIAFHSQATSLPLVPRNGHHMTLIDDILPNIVEGEDVHECTTRLICLENTLSGMVYPQDEIMRISNYCRTQGIRLHLDGARIWEASAKTGQTLQELCAPFDSVSLCLSKGIGAPIGSVLVGSEAFIVKARWFRKLFGGGTRQCGPLAAAANYSIDHVFPQLPRVHALATRLATSMADLGARILLPVETNMVFLDTTPLGFDLTRLKAEASHLPHPITITGGGIAGGRFVLHHQTSEEAVSELVEMARRMKTTDVLPDSHSIAHAEGYVADPAELIEASRPGMLRQKQKPAMTQSIPYR